MSRNHRNRQQQLILEDIQRIEPLFVHQPRVEMLGQIERILVAANQGELDPGVDRNLERVETALAE